MQSSVETDPDRVNFDLASKLCLMHNLLLKQILYMDYGNREVIDAASLRHLPERYKTSPPWAVEAKLGGVRPEDGWWTQEAVQEFKTLVEDR